ncbi:Hypothetical predicted protein [Mytilus galloprovincialis]|uniref:Uncharacterized protein n=1 Tax=Mytilus galloprovincialis TaxID=29158 RepID=A0A8B6CQV3_MYTGA|nr:Hypothetical predicted protein [Mytilus galloprovincialis]
MSLRVVRVRIHEVIRRAGTCRIIFLHSEVIGGLEYKVCGADIQKMKSDTVKM